MVLFASLSIITNYHLPLSGALGFTMSNVAVINIWHEKGWGTCFDLLNENSKHRFSISAATLSDSKPLSSSNLFPDTFEQNLELIKSVAFMLLETSQMSKIIDISGTEITDGHILEYVRSR